MGESLTSYLYRISEENGVNFKDVCELIKKISFPLKDAYKLDLLATRYIDITCLATLLKKTNSEILKLTAHNVNLKFLENLEGNNCAVVSSEFNKLERRYCKDCLREQKYFKLIWQVNELEICELHKAPLSCTCELCGIKQPYVGSQLIDFRCHFCKQSLIEDLQEESIEMESENEYYDNQKRKFQDWNFLFSENALAIGNDKYNNREMMVLKLLYIAPFNNEKKNMKADLFFYDISYAHGISNFIKNNNGNKNGGKYIMLSPKYFLKVLRHSNISLSEFTREQLPETFINNFREKDQLKGVGDCLAPWCTYFGTNKGMKSLKGGTRYYNKPHLCEGCFIKYGLHKDKKIWMSFNKDLHGIIKVFEYKGEIESWCDISKIIHSKDRHFCYRIWGYCLIHKLLINSAYQQVDINGEMLSYFKSFYNKTKSIRKMIVEFQELFSMELLDFYYILSSPNIQSILNQQLHTKKFSPYEENKKNKALHINQIKYALKRLIKDDQNVNFINITKFTNFDVEYIKSLKVTDTIEQYKQKQKKLRLHENQLKKKAMKFFSKRYEVKVNELYNSLGIVPVVLKVKYPKLYVWLEEEIKQRRYEIKNGKLKLFAGKLQLTLQRFIDRKKKISKNAIMRSMGLDINMLYKHSGYMDILNEQLSRLGI
jgi:hypothetical protein